MQIIKSAFDLLAKNRQQLITQRNQKINKNKQETRKGIKNVLFVKFVKEIRVIYLISSHMCLIYKTV